MKRTHHFVAIGVLVFLIMTGQAFADCVLNGKRLPEGTRIGSLVCEYGSVGPEMRLPLSFIRVSQSSPSSPDRQGWAHELKHDRYRFRSMFATDGCASTP
jgi:hypothetical protein